MRLRLMALFPDGDEPLLMRCRGPSLFGRQRGALLSCNVPGGPGGVTRKREDPPVKLLGGAPGAGAFGI